MKTFLCNRYNGANYELTNLPAHSGGLYVMLRHTISGELLRQHRSNLKSCFTPCGPETVTAENSPKSHAVEIK